MENWSGPCLGEDIPDCIKELCSEVVSPIMMYDIKLML